MSLIESICRTNDENLKKAELISSEIRSRISIFYGDYNRIVVAAYLLYKASQVSVEDLTLKTMLDNVDKNVKCLASEFLTEDNWNRLLRLVRTYNSEDFALTVFYPYNYTSRDTSTTPESIINLAKKVLCIENNDGVADICCGGGAFIASLAIDVPDAKWYGYEIDPGNCVVAQIRSELIGIKAEIETCDAFSLAINAEKPKFDKIFSNYPLGLMKRKLGVGEEYLAQLTDLYPGLSKATSSDWIFNSLLCDLLSENGKAIGIMTNGSSWNSIDKSARQYFVERNLVECVITLPERMFTSTQIPTTMIVFSHGNKYVRMVDASKLYQPGRRQNEFNEADIEKIVSAIHEDTDFSKTVSIDEISDNEYILNLSRYAGPKKHIQSGVPFGSIIKSITRGAPCPAKQLDEIVTKQVTNMQYLMLANIHKGIIDDELPYLSEIPKKYEKYCLKDNDLILSKNGAPYKVAVASIKEGQKILANGNLYVIELDTEKANPIYVKAFLESDDGIATLKSITVGATMPNIGIEKLKNIDIPLPPLEEQNRIAERYQIISDEISMLKLRLEKAASRLQHVLDEGNE